MRSSTIIPRAKPPVKHIPTAPTPGPPHAACASAASAAEPADDRARPVERERRELARDAGPGRDRERVAVRHRLPRGAEQRRHVHREPGVDDAPAEARSTSGWRPGISWITITAGPVPARYTSRVVPSCVNAKRSKPSSSHRRRTVAHTSDGLTSSSVRAAGLGQPGDDQHRGERAARCRRCAIAGPRPPTASLRFVARSRPGAEPATAAHEEEAVRRAPDLGREQLGVERAEREAGAGGGDDRDHRRDPQRRAVAEEERHLEHARERAAR